MGTVYYLAREDNRTLFDLGKSYEAALTWRGDHGRLDRVVVDISVVQLAKVLRWGLGFEADTSYLCELIRRIRRFAEGHEIILLDDHWLADGNESYRDENHELRTVDSRFFDNSPKSEESDYETRNRELHRLARLAGKI